MNEVSNNSGSLPAMFTSSRLFIKEHLTHRQPFCIDWQTVIFAKHFGANHVILWRTVAK